MVNIIIEKWFYDMSNLIIQIHPGDVFVDYKVGLNNVFCGSPDERFLFLLTDFNDPGIGLTGDRVIDLGKTVAFGPLRCVLDVL